jgi:hypothetical protein
VDTSKDASADALADASADTFADALAEPSCRRRRHGRVGEKSNRRINTHHLACIPIGRGEARVLEIQQEHVHLHVFSPPGCDFHQHDRASALMPGEPLTSLNPALRVQGDTPSHLVVPSLAGRCAAEAAQGISGRT